MGNNKLYHAAFDYILKEFGDLDCFDHMDDPVIIFDFDFEQACSNSFCSDELLNR
jgi:hypothetical protein